jgi:hypothetical protein
MYWLRLRSTPRTPKTSSYISLSTSHKYYCYRYWKSVIAAGMHCTLFRRVIIVGDNSAV